MSLKRLKTWRESADYNDKFFDGILSNSNLTMKSQLKMAIAISKDIIERIDKIEDEENL